MRAGPPRSPGTALRRSSGTRSVDLDDVLGRRALLALHDRELDLVALGEGLEAVPLDRRVVHEAVLAAVLGRDEPEALGVIEPLHGTGGAHALLHKKSVRRTPACAGRPTSFAGL